MTGDKPEEKCPQRQSKNRLEFLKILTILDSLLFCDDALSL